MFKEVNILRKHENNSKVNLQEYRIKENKAEIVFEDIIQVILYLFIIKRDVWYGEKITWN